jgi:NDP-sugar pyrophosphorylase family protein
MAAYPALIILAGGASSRMWPVREKLLLRFGAESLLVSQLRRFSALGFREIVIVANPDNAGAIAEQAGRLSDAAVQIAIQPTPRGMGDALLAAAEVMSGTNRPVYVTQVHDLVDDALHLAIVRAFAADASATYLAGCELEEYFPGGYLIVDDEGRVNGMVEKPGPENRPSKLVNIVAHLHSDFGRLLDAIRAEYASAAPGDDHYERAMDRLMKAQVYRVVPYRGPWHAIKYPWHVLDVMNHVLSGLKGQNVAESAFIAPTASLIGDVYIGEGAKLFPGAAVVGPAYIGAGTIVGNNALVRASMVLDRCEVGFTSEVARSYVADGCSMHACRVLDSVFMPGVNFSAGCTTANLRIDRGIVSSTIKGQKIASGRDKLGAIIGQDAFLSVDVMTMPGVKIGERAQIGPGTHVHHDVRDGARLYVKQEQIVVEDEA